MYYTPPPILRHLPFTTGGHVIVAWRGEEESGLANEAALRHALLHWRGMCVCVCVCDEAGVRRNIHLVYCCNTTQLLAAVSKTEEEEGGGRRWKEEEEE